MTDDEFDPHDYTRTARVMRWLTSIWFRFRLLGAERVPARGPCLFVGNQSGIDIADVVCLLGAWEARYGLSRRCVGMMHLTFVRAPVIGCGSRVPPVERRVRSRSMRYLVAASLVLMLASCSESSGGGGADGGSSGGTTSGTGGASGAGATGASGGTSGSGGAATDGGGATDGAGAVGSGGASGDGGFTCGGSDFTSCTTIESDGYGACSEASGFPDALQKSTFDQACTDGGGTLGTTPCSRAYPNVGGCSLPSNYCYVVWNYNPDDPSTPEDEFSEGKGDRKTGCELTGGTYYAP